MNNNGSNHGGSVSSGPSGTSGTHSGPSGRNSNGFSRNGSESKYKPNTSGSQRIFKPIPYSDEDHNRIQSLLDKVLGPEYVSCRPGGGGQKVSYIEGWKALNLANEIFGFNGWNSELISSQVDYFDTHGNTGRFSMGLSVVVRVTIKDGTYHEDFGYGYIDNAKSKAMAFEKCKKEAFTDGVKRCLRCFGNVLGNCLYDRTIIAKIQKVKLPQPEFEDDNFYRDPLLLEREHRKNNSFRMNIMETTRNTNLNYTGGRRNNQQPQEGGAPQEGGTTQIQGNLQSNRSNNRPNPTNNLPNDSPNIQPNIQPDIQPNNLPNSNNSSHLVHNKPLPTTSTIDQTTAPSPQKEYAPTSKDLEDLEDSFLFSDEMMEEDFPFADDNDELDKKGADNSNDTKDTSVEPRPPSQFPLFVSAKGASAMQQGTDDLSKLPQFDPKFVSPNIRRTLDPTKSAPVKRTEIAPIAVPSSSQVSKPPSRITPIDSSQNTSSTNNTNSTNSGPSILGKRIGMPPSQRQSKRLHKES